MRERARERERVCVCERERASERVCVCVRERERGAITCTALNQVATKEFLAASEIVLHETHKPKMYPPTPWHPVLEQNPAVPDLPPIPPAMSDNIY